MSRPKKSRRICVLPQHSSFGPLTGDSLQKDCIEMTLDEYEAIRLIDLLGCMQEDCAQQMGVARTTVQAVYNTARKKLAEALVCGRQLTICGGEYVLCAQSGECCGKNCNKRRCTKRLCTKRQPNQKMEDFNMKIAVTYENGMVFQHFGHSEQFKVYEVVDGVITTGTVVPTLGSGHGALAGFLKEQGVEALICGGIGGGARTALAQAGITLYPGVTGVADEQAAALAAGTLHYNPDTLCEHHHEGAEHDCGGTCHS